MNSKTILSVLFCSILLAGCNKDDTVERASGTISDLTFGVGNLETKSSQAGKGAAIGATAGAVLGVVATGGLGAAVIPALGGGAIGAAAGSTNNQAIVVRTVVECRFRVIVKGAIYSYEGTKENDGDSDAYKKCLTLKNGDAVALKFITRYYESNNSAEEYKAVVSGEWQIGNTTGNLL